MTQIVMRSALLAVVAYFLALVSSRVVGKKMISQMTVFDFIIGVTLGSLTANLAISKEYSAVTSATVLIVLSILTLIIDYGHIKSLFIRKVVDSEPVVVVENGRIVNQNMTKSRLTVNELLMQLREKNMFNIADVEFAILETDGKLSVLPKSQKQPVTPSDLNIPTSYKGLMKDIIIDGKIMYENLKDANLDEKWLISELNTRGIVNTNDVFFAGLDTTGNLYLSLRNISPNEKDRQYGID